MIHNLEITCKYPWWCEIVAECYVYELARRRIYCPAWQARLFFAMMRRGLRYWNGETWVKFPREVTDE